MRDYAKASSKFWTGETGKQLRALGRDYQVVGFYLFTCPSSNMLGLYYLPLPTLCHEVGHLDTEGALKVLQRLSEGGYAHYDTRSEHVFVPEMASHQIGECLTRRDNRHKALVKLLEQFRKVPFFNDFLARYREPFELGEMEFNKPLASPSGAPSKPGAGAGAGAGAGYTQDARERDSRKSTEPLSEFDLIAHIAGLKTAYPEGLYPQSDWLEAERDARQRVEEGSTWNELIAGCERYAAQCAAKGGDPQFVMSPKRFFTRREKRWTEAWPIPRTKAERQQDSNVEAGLAFLRESGGSP